MSNVQDEAIRVLKKGNAVAFTGAGVSTASGIRDYRGPNGMWKTFDPKDFSIETFRESPSYYWKKRVERKKSGFNILNSKPNPAHLALAELQDIGLLREIITQNTDGLHQKAGSKYVIELHGNASKCVCMKCSRKFPTEWADEFAGKTGSPPLCEDCNQPLKPDVVLFGEPLDPLMLELASQAVTNCESVLVVGTTVSVYPASIYPRLAKRTGASIIEINQEETQLSRDLVDISILGDCSNLLPSLVSRLR